MGRTVNAGKKVVELADNEVAELQELDTKCRNFIKVYEEANSAGAGAMLRAEISAAVGIGNERLEAQARAKRIRKLREKDQKRRLEYFARELCDSANGVFKMGIRYSMNGVEHVGLQTLLDDRSEVHWLIERKSRKEALAELYSAAKTYVERLERGVGMGVAIIALNGEGNQVRNKYPRWHKMGLF